MTRNDVLVCAEEEIGYLEKSAAAYKSNPSILDQKVSGSGADNYTKFARDVGHPNGQYWCQTFINAMFKKAFGEKMANQLLCGMLKSASTMEVKDAFKKKGQLVPISEAQPCDIMFRSRNGGGHVGLYKGNGYTIEGNTSFTDAASWNGGAVAEHKGNWEWCARPDWSLIEEIVVVPVTGKLMAITSLNIRSQPNTNSSVVGTVSKMEQVDIIGKFNTWFKTTKGWISGKYLVGWVTQDNKQWYLKEGYTYPTKTVETIDGVDYAFDRDGWLITPDRVSESGAIN